MKDRIHKLLRGAAWLGLLLLLLAGIFAAVLFIRLGVGIRPWDPGDQETEFCGEKEQPEDQREQTEENREENGKETDRESRQEVATEGEDGFIGTDPEEPGEEKPPWVMLASDLHYLSPRTHDGGEAFRTMVWEEDDGKPDQYSEEMVDALLDAAVEKQPSALILTGDITHNGELQSHMELAEKLLQVEQAGVPVLVIPGNHDINNRHASTYFGEEREAAENLAGGGEFYEIYRQFGYDEASSRDQASLSYVYRLDESHWIMMLDSCQYEEKNLVSGKIREETLEWMEEQLEEAGRQGASVLPVAHHNLLQESRMYKTECTLENGEEVTGLLERFRIPLYISGHLHAQRIKKHKAEPGTEETEYGITEIVLGPYSIPPCEYGVLEWKENNLLEFRTEEADVGQSAARRESTDGRLLDFSAAGPEMVKEVIRYQTGKHHLAISGEAEERMLELYGNLYLDYCSGMPIDRAAVTSTFGYEMWMRVGSDSRYVREMEEMMKDSEKGSRRWAQQEEET